MPPTALRGSFDEGPRRPPLGIEHGLARTTSEDSTDYSRIALGHNARGERTDSGGTTSSRDAPASSRGWRSPASALTSQSSCSRRNSVSSAVLSDDGRARSPDAEEQEESMSSGSDDGEEEGELLGAAVR